MSGGVRNARHAFRTISGGRVGQGMRECGRNDHRQRGQCRTRRSPCCCGEWPRSRYLSEQRGLQPIPYQDLGLDSFAGPGLRIKRWQLPQHQFCPCRRLQRVDNGGLSLHTIPEGVVVKGTWRQTRLWKTTFTEQAILTLRPRRDRQAPRCWDDVDLSAGGLVVDLSVVPFQKGRPRS